jgi:hypothetical protein
MHIGLDPGLRDALAVLDTVGALVALRYAHAPPAHVRGRALKGSYIVAIQRHGRNRQYNPPLHFLAIRGGWDQQARQWIPMDYVP